MKKTLLPLALLCVLALLVFQSGCGSDDDPNDSPTEQCSFKVITPDSGSTYLSNESVNIRWDKTGPASHARIELVKGDVVRTSIVESTENDGYYWWPASTMGHVSGTDYAIRVSAVGDTLCAALSEEFELINTIGCVMQVTAPAQADSFSAGDVTAITWTGENFTNSVDIELMVQDEVVGLIGGGIFNNGSYDWTVDSFNQGNYEYYRIRITDGELEDCFDISGQFEIVDEDICQVFITSPISDEQWTVGDTETIIFDVDNGSEFVNIRLYLGESVLVGVIADNVPAASGQFSWVVDNFGNEESPNNYRIRVYNSEDLYCVDSSPRFTILVP